MKVGIIGVGLMGHGIARNVLGKGKFDLGFLDHPGNQPVDEITGLGAVAYDTPAALAAACLQVLIIMTCLVNLVIRVILLYQRHGHTAMTLTHPIIEHGL